MYSSPDWVQAALDLLGGRAGITGEFKYSTVGVQILSGILVNATGMPIADFAAERLFTPLGIKKPRNIILHNKEEHFAFLKECHPTGWVIDPKGVNTAGWGLCLSPRDMVKIGELYRNGGIYDGKRLLSSAWIEESTREQSRWGEMPYGYLWWLHPRKPLLCSHRRRRKYHFGKSPEGADRGSHFLFYTETGPDNGIAHRANSPYICIVSTVLQE